MCQYFKDEIKDKTCKWWYGYRLSRFPGNKWEKPLGDDELTVLYMLFKELSFIKDFLGKYMSQKIEKSIKEGP